MNEKNTFSKGQVVISKAGRDKLRKFIIVDIINEDYVLICDGKLRKIEKPKLKKTKHLAKTSYIANKDISTNKMLIEELKKAKEGRS